MKKNKLDSIQRARKAGTASWAKLSKEEKSARAKKMAKGLWARIRKGEYANTLDK